MPGGAPKVYLCPRRTLSVRLHPEWIEGLHELAYRQRSTINDLVERFAADALVDAGLPAPDPRRSQA